MAYSVPFPNLEPIRLEGAKGGAIKNCLRNTVPIPKPFLCKLIESLTGSQHIRLHDLTRLYLKYFGSSISTIISQETCHPSLPKDILRKTSCRKDILTEGYLAERTFTEKEFILLPINVFLYFTNKCVSINIIHYLASKKSTNRNPLCYCK